MHPFLARLKTRKIAQWSVAYLAAAWLVLQVLDLLADTYPSAAPLPRYALPLLAIGFLAALVLAWYHGEKGRQRVSAVELILLGGILAIGVAAAGLVARGGSGEPPAAAEPASRAAEAAVAEQGSIAVLPFADMSAARDQEYFADGLTEELLNVLAQLPELRVASRTSAFAFKGRDVGIDSIAKALHVAHVLEGSVRADGGRLRITAQLIDAQTGFHAWSQTYDREVKSIFAVQDEIARAIVAALELRLGGGRAGATLADEETADPEAHALVLRATQQIRMNTRELLAEAVSGLRQAIARDPGYARAHALLGHAYLTQAYRRYGPHKALADSARAEADRALALDPNLPEAHYTHALLAMDLDQDARAAAEHLQLAVKHGPGVSSYRSLLGWVLTELGESERGIAETERAVAMDPLSPGTHNNLAAMYSYAGRHREALEEYRAALALSASPTNMANMAVAQALAGQPEDALETIQEAFRLAPGEQYVLAVHAYVQGKLGRRAEAERLLRQIEAQPEPAPYMLATGYAALGERAKVLRLLEQAVAEKDPSAMEIASDPVFADYQREPRVRKLVAKLRLR